MFHVSQCMLPITDLISLDFWCICIMSKITGVIFLINLVICQKDGLAMVLKFSQDAINFYNPLLKKYFTTIPISA